MLPNEGLHIGRAIDPGETGVKDELGHPRGGLNFDLQDVRLRREQHPELQLLGGHLVGHGVGGVDEHLIGYARRVCGVDRQADGGEDIEVVGLRRQKRLAVEVNWRKLHAAGIDRLAPGPGVSLLGQAVRPLPSATSDKVLLFTR